MRLRTTVATLIAGMLALPASASASSIVYGCFDAANLCRVDPDTHSQVQLTTDGQPGTSNVYGGPSLSRDGTKLAFVFNNQLIVGDANAANRSAPFPGSTFAFAALMRPDGGAVAEVEQTLSAIPYEVCTYNLDGSGRNCYWGTKGTPGWAPDNGLLISVGGGPPNYYDQIDHCPIASGSCSVEASDPANNLFDPVVSPDGSTLAVVVSSGSTPSGHIALYNYATGQYERDLTNGSDDQLPTWSPDGSQIAFQRGTSIYVIHANGLPSSAQQVALGFDPTWGGAASSGGSGTGVPHTHLSSRKIDRRHHRAKFEFGSSGYASGFQCALVKGHRQPNYANCHPPKTYNNLRPGKYKFYVRAFNGAGDDPTPASVKFSI